METIISGAIDNLDDEHLEQAIVDFLAEEKLVGEFLVWIEKWKHNHEFENEGQGFPLPLSLSLQVKEQQREEVWKECREKIVKLRLEHGRGTMSWEEYAKKVDKLLEDVVAKTERLTEEIEEMRQHGQ